MALTAAGRVAAARGDPATALEHARRAVAAARAVRTTDLLADALELEAAVVDDPTRSRAALTEALSIWSGGGAWPAAARVEVLIGSLPDADGTERSRARDAARSLRRIGIPVVGGRTLGGDGAEPGVHVAVLGPFTVTVAGAEVPLPAWRSRQARTLVKILAAHRGRVVTRARLCDLLWPDDDPARTGHRLSVLLATVRGVLDPAKAWPPTASSPPTSSGCASTCRTSCSTPTCCCATPPTRRHCSRPVTSTGRARCWPTSTCSTAARPSRTRPRSGPTRLREEVRSAWVRSVRRLATLQSREGLGAEALGIFVRLLSVDPFDEQVHRRLVTSLVRAGRHGEARRAFERWHAAMVEIDAPLPDPRLVAATPAERGPARRSDATLTPCRHPRARQQDTFSARPDLPGRHDSQKEVAPCFVTPHDSRPSRPSPWASPPPGCSSPPPPRPTR